MSSTGSSENTDATVGNSIGEEISSSRISLSGIRFARRAFVRAILSVHFTLGRPANFIWQKNEPPYLKRNAIAGETNKVSSEFSV